MATQASAVGMLSLLWAHCRQTNSAAAQATAAGSAGTEAVISPEKEVAKVQKLLAARTHILVPPAAFKQASPQAILAQALPGKTAGEISKAVLIAIDILDNKGPFLAMSWRNNRGQGHEKATLEQAAAILEDDHYILHEGRAAHYNEITSKNGYVVK